MSVQNPSIQGIGTGSRTGTRYDSLSLGEAYTVRVDNANSFYTTKVSSLVIDNTTYTAPVGNTAGSLVFGFSGSPDLSEVMVGNYLRVNDCSDLDNTGDFKITAIDNSAKTITVETYRGVTNASSAGNAETLPFVGAYSIECIEDTTGLAVSEDGSAGASVPELFANVGLLGFFTEVTIATSGTVDVKCL